MPEPAGAAGAPEAAGLPDDVVRAVCRHMDDDHADAALRIVQVLGGEPAADRVQTVGVDTTSISFLAHTGETTTPVTVAFSQPAADRTAVRLAVVALSERAQRGG